MTPAHPSTLPAELIQAYRETQYISERTPVGPVSLRIGEPCAELANLLASSPDAGAAFVTAYNPYGLTLPASLNQRRQDELRAIVEANQWEAYDGAGIGVDVEAWEP
jgi:hypothetical protein